MSGAGLLGARHDGEDVHFRVWAPEHQRLDVVLYGADGRTEVGAVPTRREADGHFVATYRAGPAALLYKLRVGEAGPFPDPLSRSQPFGVHGPSEVALEAFDWTDQSFPGVALEDLVIYEVHVGTATAAGTFDALIAILPHIRELGATAIELMPLASFPGTRNWGYDGVSLYAPSAAYGGPAGLMRLVDAAHAAGLGVLVDVVYNHFGPDGNYLRCYSDRYFTSRHTTPWGDAINVDGDGAAPVRELVLRNAAMWIERFHADGLRLDATHAIHDDRRPHVLEEIGVRARAAGGGRAVVVIAEDERNDARLVTPASSGGLGLDGVWADDFHHQMRRAFAGDDDGYYVDFTGSAVDLARTVERGWFYEGQPSTHHGKPRGTDASPAAPPQLVHCIQNHDQIGNRAMGDRLGQKVSPQAFRAMSALLLLSPYTPLLFMGQEWNATTPFLYFTDHEPELGRLVTEGRRREFEAFTAFAGALVPDPQAPETLERSRLDWREPSRSGHAGVLAWYRELLRLRREHPAARGRARGDHTCRASGEHTLTLERRAGGAVIALVVNLRGELTLPIDAGLEVVAWSEESRFDGDGRSLLDGGALRLTGPSAAVLGSRGSWTPRAAAPSSRSSKAAW